MTVETLLLAATTLIALVAVGAAVLALRAVRELKSLHSSAVEEPSSLQSSETGRTNAEIIVSPAMTNAEIFVPDRPAELAPRVVHGRVIVPPTQAQVLRTALGRPGVRLSVFAHGLAHALRAENRDRIIALMRREFVHRRKQRLRAGKQAIRTFHPTASPSSDRLHEHLLEPRPMTLTDRMIGS